MYQDKTVKDVRVHSTNCPDLMRHNTNYGKYHIASRNHLQRNISRCIILKSTPNSIRKRFTHVQVMSMKESKMVRSMLVQVFKEKYLWASRKEKSQVLDQFVEATGFNRSYARTVLRKKKDNVVKLIPRRSVYPTMMTSDSI